MRALSLVLTQSPALSEAARAQADLVKEEVKQKGGRNISLMDPRAFCFWTKYI